MMIPSQAPNPPAAVPIILWMPFFTVPSRVGSQQKAYAMRDERYGDKCFETIFWVQEQQREHHRFTNLQGASQNTHSSKVYLELLGWQNWTIKEDGNGQSIR